MIYVLDTNIAIYLFKGMGRVAERINALSPREIAIPTVVLFELYVGIAKSKNPATRTRLVEGLAARSIVLPFDQKAASCAATVRAQLEKQGQPIGPMDVLIVGTAIANKTTLVTHNTREFSKVNGLVMEDWF